MSCFGRGDGVKGHAAAQARFGNVKWLAAVISFGTQVVKKKKMDPVFSKVSATLIPCPVSAEVKAPQDKSSLHATA